MAARPTIDTISPAELVAVTGGGIDCDSLRDPYAGAFKPEDDRERQAALLCIQDGHPLVKRLR